MVFELSKLEDTVRIIPSEFSKPLLTAVTDSLNEKYPNKVRRPLTAAVTHRTHLLHNAGR